MDWTLAIDRNRNALLRALAMLFAMARGGAAVSLPRQVRYAILRALRPAESATRRLIVIVAHVAVMKGLSMARRSPHPAPGQIPPRKAGRLPSFPLFDPLKRFGPRPLVATGPGPRLSVPGFADPVFADAPSPDDPVSATRLCRRLRSLQMALDNLPAQARRLARWRLKRSRSVSGRTSPMRPGWPPGHRARPVHEVDTILGDCHALALHALQPP